jgi:uncharacterized protein (DUF433 family)
LWAITESAVAYRAGDSERAKQYAYAVLSSADLCRDESLRLKALINLALVDLQNGDLSAAEMQFETARTLAEALDARLIDRGDVPRVLGNLATVLYLKGDWVRAQQVAQSLLFDMVDRAEKEGQRFVVMAHLLLGNIARAQGLRGAAKSHCTAAATLAKEGEYARELALAMELAADMALDENKFDEAAASYENILQEQQRNTSPDPVLRCEVRRKFADVRRRQGDITSAHELALGALNEAQMVAIEKGASLRVLALTEAERRDISAARRHAQEAAAILRKADARYELMLTLHAAADLLLDRSASLLEARRLAEELDIPSTVKEIDSQLRLPEARPLADVPSLLQSRVDEGRVTIEPDKCGGKPCIRGMWITVQDVLEYLAFGMTQEEILADFPYLTSEDISMSLKLAAEVLDRPLDSEHVG